MRSDGSVSAAGQPRRTWERSALLAGPLPARIPEEFLDPARISSIVVSLVKLASNDSNLRPWIRRLIASDAEEEAFFARLAAVRLSPAVLGLVALSPLLSSEIGR